MRKEIKIDKEILFEKYVNQGKSQTEIAKELNLDYLGIEFEEDFFNYARKRLND